MCTAISFNSDCHYFGRTLDYNISFGEQIIITPRNLNFKFKYTAPLNKHYAIIGMATLVHDIPLYFDATNEVGLSVAALLFSENAKYFPPKHGYTNIASFEVIPYILANCKTVEEARRNLSNINITNDNFNDQLKATPLHWLISDSKNSIVLESVDSGIEILDNPIGVLTNNPPFKMQLWNLSQYINLSTKTAINRFSEKIALNPLSKGMGGVGLPGDFSSASRFVRSAFLKLNSALAENELSSVIQFFNILNNVSITKGVVLEKDGYEITRYTSCCNTTKGIYYYTTYNNPSISAVNMHCFDMNASTPICFDLNNQINIYFHK